MSIASFQSVVYASTIGARERWREKLEQGMFAYFVTAVARAWHIPSTEAFFRSVVHGF